MTLLLQDLLLELLMTLLLQEEAPEVAPDVLQLLLKRRSSSERYSAAVRWPSAWWCRVPKWRGRWRWRR